jgi:hypothetical protein
VFAKLGVRDCDDADARVRAVLLYLTS